MPECGCNCFTFCTLLLTSAAATIGAIVYQQVTGNEIPFIGDKLPENLTGLIDAGQDIVDNAGDKIDSIDWPDFGFDYDGKITPDETGNNTNAPQLEYAWKTKNGEGLELHIENALTADWDGVFQIAIEDWQASDVLTLTTSKVDEDPECTPKSNIMRVCNKDYGETGWKGINEILTQGKTIVSSVAKMNEYYVGQNIQPQRTKIEDERRYTMCHEIGHGFGLPHQDEDFLNEDLLSCMDYSMKPANNLIPNDVDFGNLNQLYGENDRKRQRFLRETTIYHLNGEKVDRHVYYIPA